MIACQLTVDTGSEQRVTLCQHKCLLEKDKTTVVDFSGAIDVGNIAEVCSHLQRIVLSAVCLICQAESGECVLLQPLIEEQMPHIAIDGSAKRVATSMVGSIAIVSQCLRGIALLKEILCLVIGLASLTVARAACQQ